MRYLWVDKGNNPWWEAISANQIDGLFFDPRDPRVDQKYLEDNCQAKFRVAGIYIGAFWGELGNTPESYVSKVREWLVPLRKSNVFPKVQLDIEDHNIDYVVDILKMWRKLFPYQDTSWTVEPWQAGLFDGRPELVEIVKNLRIRIVPQYFLGDMTPVAEDRAFREWLVRGFPWNIISGCYDASRLHDRWDGYAFTQGRLPSP